MKTIVTEIEDLEKSVAKCEERLDVIERLQRLTMMTHEERSELKQEKKLLEQKLVDNRKQLKSLRWENGKSMIISVMILGVLYAGWMMYS
nr:coiled-coil domain-containing protein 167-like [Biomphalaria glabrata]